MGFMAEGSSRGNLKRPFVDDDESNKPPPEKRARFPKGKKVKQGDYVTDGSLPRGEDLRVAARDREFFRIKLTEELFDGHSGFVPDVKAVEEKYQDDEALNEEGPRIEPFNLEREREEGYFDENGNYVEYMNQKEIKDAWLDSVDACEKYTGKKSIPTRDDKPQDLTMKELAEINRRIADVLEPGESGSREFLVHLAASFAGTTGTIGRW